ncbi:unnamed protein product [Lactuca saligna]|uniref:Wall-associated receptor kinase C-terminal domain-containing protein n=1 Tax=Lactuca saligna TaxID=75948 RepID=A0AA35ZWY3_LACSI|nr:unnamed protein product [Lactuca saligna]
MDKKYGSEKNGSKRITISKTSYTISSHVHFGLDLNEDDALELEEVIRSMGQQDIPIINLEYESYYIQNITYGTRSIILQDYDVFTAVHCPRMNHNITIKSLPFIFSDQNVNLSIHFNCNRVPHFAHEILCLSSRTNKSCVNSVHSEPADFNWDAYSCDDDVSVTTVLDVFRSINELGIEFIRALRGGFELQWWEIEDCEMCENSDGRCGYNNDTREFMCFCSSGTSTKGDCKATNSAFGSLPPTCVFIETQ